MKILIIGNIGSGKSTLGKKIFEITGFKFIQIDDFREKYLKSKVSEEYYCQYQFLRSIEENENIICEFTGVGWHKFAVKRILELSKDLVLIILCKTKLFSTLRERVKEKKFNYGNPFKLDIYKHIHFVENELNQDLCSKFWLSKNFSFIEVFMENLDDFKVNELLIQKLINSNDDEYNKIVKKL